MKTIFITGGNGLLGTNLIKLLLDKGYRVKALVRNISSYNGVLSKNLELLEGNLFDDFTELFKSIDYLIHIAAVTSQNILSESYYWKINSHATKLLYQTAAKSKIKKFVFVSTANTIGFGSKEIPGFETNEMRFPFSSSSYAQSKKSAENFILNTSNAMQTIIVNPSFMLGAYDTKPSSGKIIYMGWKKKLVFYPPGGKNFVHVEDVAEGILKALLKGKTGEKYILANENLSYYDFFQKLNSICNQSPIMIKIPRSVLILLGYIGNFLRFLHIRTSLNLTNARILCVNNFYSNKKSVQDLKLSYKSTDNAIKDAVEYFKYNT